MAIFPTQYSTLAASALKDRIAERYALKDATCRLLLHGVSDTYLLQDATTKYILKIYRSAHRSLTEIKGEVELLNIMKAEGAKVSYPIGDAAGEYVQAFNAAEGTRHGVLFSFAPGSPVYDLTDEQLRTVGREMAFNHNITARISLQHERKSYDVHTTLIRPLQRLETAFDHDPEGFTYLSETADHVIRRMKTLDTAAFGYGYCHYDYLPKNFHFDEAGQLTLFDFDFAGKGYLASDITSFQVHLFFSVTYAGMAPEEADRQYQVFLDGYRELRSLTDDELTAVPYLGFMFWVFYLSFARENFDDWSNFFFTPRYLKERVGLIRRYMGMYTHSVH
ncbi:hypothetical protein GCM10023189_46480 [Nibrella saemangeumensis]|uniref:Aminoglycoside phosphotransferase domain-containing protein n=1 Tax=Nibrella saemangeumensis TaxID=1084526 RepID=A0ABP8NFS3_9BACT